MNKFYRMTAPRTRNVWLVAVGTIAAGLLTVALLQSPDYLLMANPPRLELLGNQSIDAKATLVILFTALLLARIFVWEAVRSVVLTRELRGFASTLSGSRYGSLIGWLEKCFLFCTLYLCVPVIFVVLEKKVVASGSMTLLSSQISSMAIAAHLYFLISDVWIKFKAIRRRWVVSCGAVLLVFIYFGTEVTTGLAYRTGRALRTIEITGLEQRNFDLTNARALRMTVRNVDLPQADFSNSNLARGSFVNFKSNGSNFSGTNFGASELRGFISVKSEFAGADFYGASIENGLFSGSNFVEANFRKARLVGVDFRGADFAGALFGGAEFKNVDFSSADLSQSKSLDRIQLWFACGDNATRLPAGLSIRRCQ